MKRLLFVVLSTMLMIAIIITVCGTALADAACPSIGSTVYELDARNDVVRWVQNELKATGVWYQGNEWKVTGHLGKGTMREISRFMEYMGYPGQSGAITQKVIDVLWEYNYGGNPIQEPIADPTIPNIGNAVYELDARNDTVRWVQNQLKATGVWYQGSEWKVTGHLGKGTMREISRFMEYMGYPGQSGAITQKVIDALCQYLGDGITSVDYNARASGSNNSNSTDAGETIRCSCGGIMTCEVFTGGYTSDETGHCLDTGRIFTCQSCGAQGFEGAPGEGTWEPHVFNGYNICTVCGFDRGD